MTTNAQHATHALAVFRVHGPVPAQDGRPVWQLLRTAHGGRAGGSVLECMSETLAAKTAAQLNAAPHVSPVEG